MTPDATSLPKLFGANMRRERVMRKMTQEKLAEQADLNIRTVQKIEAGSITILITTAFRIQQALDCPWEKLMPATLIGQSAEVADNR